jgi:hypothetical protein
MPVPTDDPIILQIMTMVCTALGKISQANGFYNNVAGIGIEPLAFNQGDSYPQIVVHEESGRISDSTPNGYQDSAVLAVHGFIPVDATNAYVTALKLRDDITRVVRSITPKTFQAGPPPATGYINSGKQLVMTWTIDQQREVIDSEIAEGFLEVVVRAAVDYRDFSPPFSGI